MKLGGALESGTERIVTATTMKAVAAAAGVRAASMARARDLEAGKALLGTCVACHAVDTATNKAGRHRGDAIGRTAGTVEGYTYSTAMKDAGAAGLLWDEAHLAEHRVAPKARAPGSGMAFAGIGKLEEPASPAASLKTPPE